MRGFMPSAPNDKQRSQIEIANWRAELEAAKKREKRDTRRYWLTTVCAIIAAIAAVAGVVLQLIAMQ